MHEMLNQWSRSCTLIFRGRDKYEHSALCSPSKWCGDNKHTIDLFHIFWKKGGDFHPVSLQYPQPSKHLCEERVHITLWWGVWLNSGSHLLSTDTIQIYVFLPAKPLTNKELPLWLPPSQPYCPGLSPPKQELAGPSLAPSPPSRPDQKPRFIDISSPCVHMSLLADSDATTIMPNITSQRHSCTSVWSLHGIRSFVGLSFPRPLLV